MHADHLGTPKTATDAAQGIAWAADYLPYGEAQVTVEAVTLNVRFPGQYFDAETELYYNYSRNYGPNIGRYLESDLIGLNGGLNTYAYANANPLRFADPLGLSPLDCVHLSGDAYLDCLFRDRFGEPNDFLRAIGTATAGTLRCVADCVVPSGLFQFGVEKGLEEAANNLADQALIDITKRGQQVVKIFGRFFTVLTAHCVVNCTDDGLASCPTTK